WALWRTPRQALSQALFSQLWLSARLRTWLWRRLCRLCRRLCQLWRRLWQLFSQALFWPLWLSARPRPRRLFSQPVFSQLWLSARRRPRPLFWRPVSSPPWAPRRRQAPRPSPPRRSSDLPGAGVAAEDAGRRELAELVADHRLADEDGDVFLAVVHRDRVTDHLREDRRRARPRAQHFFVVLRVEGFDAAEQPLFDPRTLLARAAHQRLLPFPLLRPRTM